MFKLSIFYLNIIQAIMKFIKFVVIDSNGKKMVETKSFCAPGATNKSCDFKYSTVFNSLFNFSNESTTWNVNEKCQFRNIVNTAFFCFSLYIISRAYKVNCGMAVNIKNILIVLMDKYKHIPVSVLTNEELKIADNIIEMLEGHLYGQVEIDESLEVDELGSYSSEESDEELIDNNGDDEDSVFAANSERQYDTSITIEQKKAAVEYCFLSNGSRRPLQSVMNRYRYVTSYTQLYRWQKQITDGGSRIDKMKMINEYVLERFTDARRNFGIVHDIDLRKWAMQKQKDVGLTSFTASSFWVHSFKKKQKIVSRKITKVLSRKQISDLPTLKTRIDDYRSEAKLLIAQIECDQVFNTDQVGFNIELLSRRTLNQKGEKQILSSINQSRSETHSYTTQPTISVSGELLPPLMIILQEKDGIFGPLVRQNLFTHPEIFVLANSSGKVTKQILKQWFLVIYFPSVRKKSVLILDSLSTYKDSEDIDEDMPLSKTYNVSSIPPGLTPHCQPLDVGFNRPYKSFVRRISDHINFHHPEIKLHLRNTLLKLQAWTFFQLRSPRFKQFIKYCWYKAGLIDIFDRASRFDDPMNYCFDKELTASNCCGCEVTAFIRCSWCTKTFCFDHFFTVAIDDDEFNEFHYCLNYIQIEN